MATRSFKSGNWEGTYTQAGKTHKIALELDFSHDTVSGSGVDETHGSFTVEGKYNSKPPYGIEMTATYGAHTMNFTGWRESKGGLFGEFKMIPAGSGQFQMSPTAGGGAAAKLLEAKQKTLITQLEALGFAKWQCEAAASLHDSPEACVEWLMNGGAAELAGGPDEGGAAAPAAGGGASGGAAGAAAAAPPEEAVATLVSMGFPRARAIEALKANGNNAEMAVDWLFAHS